MKWLKEKLENILLKLIMMLNPKVSGIVVQYEYYDV